MYSHFKCTGTRTDGSSCTEPLEKRHILASRTLAVQNYNETHSAEPEQESPAGEVQDASSDKTESDHQSNPQELATETIADTSSNDTLEIPLEDLTVSCFHEEVECPNQCGVSVPKYLLETHIETKCRHCPTQCPTCEATLERQELPRHLEVCPESIVPCNAAEYGCIWVGKRSQFYSKHQRQCTFVAFAPALNKQGCRMDKLEQENKALRHQLDRVLSCLGTSAIPVPDAGSFEQSSGSLTEPGAQHIAGWAGAVSRRGIHLSESDLMHVFMESERLREDVDRLNTQVSEMEMRHNMSIMQESFRTSEELTALRGLTNSLRHQIHFLLADRKSWAASMQHLQFQQHQHMFPLSQNTLLGGAGVMLAGSGDGFVGEGAHRSSDSRSRQDLKL